MTEGLAALTVVAVAVYAAATLWLAVVALQTLALALVRLARPQPPAPRAEGPWPPLVVQIPVYDEPAHLVARALDAAVALRARGPVEVQLLDDSRDPSAGAALCAQRDAPGRPVRHVVRTTRDGYKAGALAAGLNASRAEIAAIFDVDFRPAPDALDRLVPVLLADASLAFVQARWAHPDAHRTALGRAQAALLDLHFGVEQAGRDRAGLPVTFNGTAGVWRRHAINAAGGWQGDTLAEDLDLAIRAHAAGWRARVLDDVTVDADLPPTVAAWRRQQARWAKGLAEVAIKLLPALWRSPLRLRDRLSVAGQLAMAGSLPALAALVVAHPLAAIHAPAWVGAVGLAALTAALAAHGVAQHARGLTASTVLTLPLVLAAPLLLVVPATRGVAQALAGRRTAFARTPKDGRPRRDPDRGWDAALAVYCAAGSAALAAGGHAVPALVQGVFGAALAVAAWTGRRRVQRVVGEREEARTFRRDACVPAPASRA